MVLGSITAIDFDIAFGQVASEDAGFTVSIGAMRNFDANLRFIKFGLQLVFVKRRGKSLFAHKLALQIDVDVRRVELYTRVSSSTDDATPVRITARDCGLHQRRVCDRACDPPGVFGGFESHRTN